MEHLGRRDDHAAARMPSDPRSTARQEFADALRAHRKPLTSSTAGWLEEGQLIRDAARLKAIPAIIVQGRYDIACPVASAWDLHRAWPEAEFRLVEGAGHAFSGAGHPA